MFHTHVIFRWVECYLIMKKISDCKLRQIPFYINNLPNHILAVKSCYPHRQPQFLYFLALLLFENLSNFPMTFSFWQVSVLKLLEFTKDLISSHWIVLWEIAPFQVMLVTITDFYLSMMIGYKPNLPNITQGPKVLAIKCFKLFLPLLIADFGIHLPLDTLELIHNGSTMSRSSQSL